jgi:hypothetical protein
MKISTFFSLSAAVVIAIVIGCGQPTPSNKPASAEGQKFLLTSEPAGAEDVSAVKAAAKDNEEVVVVGRIGGSVDPWVKGMAAFTIADVAIKACSELEGDTCPTPWDYCCEDQTELAKRVLPVRFQDESGDVIGKDARELFEIKELSTVVVRGKIKSDTDSVKLIATGIHIKK